MHFSWSKWEWLPIGKQNANSIAILSRVIWSISWCSRKLSRSRSHIDSELWVSDNFDQHQIFSREIKLFYSVLEQIEFAHPELSSQFLRIGMHLLWLSKMRKRQNSLMWYWKWGPSLEWHVQHGNVGIRFAAAFNCHCTTGGRWLKERMW